MLSLAAFARLLGVSRRTARRLLEQHRIPFEQARRGTFPQRGTGIRIMLADLRLYAPRLQASVEKAVELGDQVVISRP